jgi:hypothetical protein
MDNDDGTTTTKVYDTQVFNVYGGKYKLRKASERKSQEIEDRFKCDSQESNAFTLTRLKKMRLASRTLRCLVLF